MFRKEKNGVRTDSEVENLQPIPSDESVPSSEGVEVNKADLRLEQQKLAGQNAHRVLTQNRERTATRVIREVKVDEEITWQPEFTEVKAPCFLVDMQFSRSGDVIFKIRVPYRWRKLVMGLSEAYNTPLEAHIYKWSKADNERSRLAELYRNRQKGSGDPYELGSDGTTDDGSDGASTISSDDDLC